MALGWMPVVRLVSRIMFHKGLLKNCVKNMELQERARD